LIFSCSTFDGAGEDGRAMAEAGVIGSTDSDDERA
jgi:hypothetical protein